MSICDLTSGVGRLQRATKELRDAWIETKQYWDDQTAEEFEKQYLDPILPHVRLVLAEAHEIRSTFDKAERACRDERELAD